jgi:transcriptional regulator with XRE-family HTH domain
MNTEFAITLRAKKLGILLKDARQNAGKTMKECGAALGVSGSTIGSYEKGVSSPSLSEIEILCYLFKLPLNRFWKDTIIAEERETDGEWDQEEYISARNQQVGTILSAAREKLGKTFEEITTETGITYGRMKRFEAGETPIPLPELELLSNTLEIPLADFFEGETKIGKWISAQDNIHEFLSLPSEVQQFITKPTNLPYIQIAMKLSNLSAEQLRTIAESLLEITI